MGFAAQQQQQQELGQLDALKFRILKLSWWVNFILGAIGAVVAAPFGFHFGMPWYVAAAFGFVVGFILPHYLYKLILTTFWGIAFWAGWFLLAHYNPHVAQELSSAWTSFKGSL